MSENREELFEEERVWKINLWDEWCDCPGKWSLTGPGKLSTKYQCLSGKEGGGWRRQSWLQLQLCLYHKGCGRGKWPHGTRCPWGEWHSVRAREEGEFAARSGMQLEKDMSTHSSILAWRIPGMEEPGGLLSMGLHRVGHHWSYIAAAAGMQQSPHHLPPFIHYLLCIPHTASVSWKVSVGLEPQPSKGRDEGLHIAFFLWSWALPSVLYGLSVFYICLSVFYISVRIYCIEKNFLIKYLFSSVQFSHSIVSDSSQPHGPQHARLPCPSPTPRVCSNSCPLSQWCHPTISSSVVPFFSYLQSLPPSGSFQMSQLFTLGGQSIGVSVSTSVLPMNTQNWSPLGWTAWMSLQSKGLSTVFSNTTVQKHQFFAAQLSL